MFLSSKKVEKITIIFHFQTFICKYSPDVLHNDKVPVCCLNKSIVVCLRSMWSYNHICSLAHESHCNSLKCVFLNIANDILYKTNRDVPFIKCYLPILRLISLYYERKLLVIYLSHFRQSSLIWSANLPRSLFAPPRFFSITA